MWSRIVELFGEEIAERMRQEFAGETVRFPKKQPKETIVLIVKAELKSKSYQEIAQKYKLSERTIRNYERWEIKEDRIISPDGRSYLKSKF